MPAAKSPQRPIVLAIAQTGAYMPFITDRNPWASVAERRGRAPAHKLGETAVPQSHNRLLASLPAEDFAVVQPHLKTVEMRFADVLSHTDQAVTRVHFPHAGVISLVV